MANAGGVNPEACRELPRQRVAAGHGAHQGRRVAGDDIIVRLDEFIERGVTLEEPGYR